MKSYSANPVCCPARACWYTGRASSEHGLLDNNYDIDPSIPDLGPHMTQAGYHSVYAGKWHVNGRSLSNSFEVLHQGSGKGEYGDTECIRACQAFLRERTDDKPFFLNIGLLNPHDCCFWFDYNYGPGKYGFAENLTHPLPELPSNFDRSKIQTNAIRAQQRPWSERDWRYYIYSYYRMTEMVDQEIGKFLDTLENSPYADNTVLIFSADHGDGCGYHNRVSKGNFYEEVAQVPLVICHPATIERGRRDTQHLACGYDIAPTICDFAQTSPLPDQTVSRSLKPACEDENAPGHEYVASEFARGQHEGTMIRRADYKALFLTRSNTVLYDIVNDPMETTDLAGDPAHAAILTQHAAYKTDYDSRIIPLPAPSGG